MRLATFPKSSFPSPTVTPVSKPYRAADLLRSLEIVTEIVDTGAAFPPFPRGLQILHPGITGMPAVLI